jgi:hypothetical protein
MKEEDIKALSRAMNMICESNDDLLRALRLHEGALRIKSGKFIDIRVASFNS